MSETVLSLIITAGLFALTAAWVPFLDRCHRSLRRARGGANSPKAEAVRKEAWMHSETEIEAA